MNQEHILSPDLVILSRSDLQGNILDYNAGFRDASGYTDAELKGKPHSLLRHPDMPKEAFADFWKTVQAGLPWFGIVKNKRKNGDYYWVAANAAPIFENGRITSYVSVRYPASREQVAFADKLYADLRAQRTQMPWTSVDRKTPYLLGGIAAVGTLASMASIAFAGAFSNPSALLSGLVAVGSLGFLAYKAFQLRMPNATQRMAIDRLSNGDFSHNIAGNDPWTFGLNQIRSRLAEFAAKQYDAAKESAVLTTALNSASTNLMVADAEFNILSINDSLAQMFKRNEKALQNALPHFRAETVIGSNMDIFHKTPAHQRQMVSQLSQAWSGEIKIAGLVLKLSVVPILNRGNKMGYVVEWLDRTQEAKIAEDIVRVTNAMQNGSFNERIVAEASGSFQVMKENLNDALNNIATAIDSISKVVGAQAEGDLTQKLPDRVFKGQLHTLKNAINFSSERVKLSVTQAISASTVVHEAATQVAMGASDLSSRVQTQAAALEQTSSTMQQMTSAVQSNTSNAHKVASLAHQVQHQAGAGVEVMQKTISAMQSIKESSNKIADIVTLIDGIAFQTNLLALNAAVEAARAGEHGRGFAVVAGEVRALAQKSSSAAKEIRDLIGDSVIRVENGTHLAEKSGEMLNGVTGSIEQVANMIEAIAHASNEQAIGIAQVNQTLGDIDRVTQENAALVEETTAASESLSTEANSLRENMSFFKTGQANTARYQAPISPKAKRLGLPSR